MVETYFIDREWVEPSELDGSPHFCGDRPVYCPRVDMGIMVHQQHTCSCAMHGATMQKIGDIL